MEVERIHDELRIEDGIRYLGYINYKKEAGLSQIYIEPSPVNDNIGANYSGAPRSLSLLLSYNIRLSYPIIVKTNKK